MRARRAYLISAGRRPCRTGHRPWPCGSDFPINQTKAIRRCGNHLFHANSAKAPVRTLSNYARDLIQFGSFAEEANNPFGNHGVAPDFACGHWVLLPDWCRQSIDHSRDKQNANGVFSFVDKNIAGRKERLARAFSSPSTRVRKICSR